MKYSFYILSSFIISTLLYIGCARPPDYPNEPVIEYSRISSNLMSQAKLDDRVLATISFTDGDGDLGDDDGRTTLFIKDLRDDSPENSAKILPKVPEPGANNGISGEITFQLLNSCCIWPLQFLQAPCTPSTDYPVDTIVYEVYIVDRAGNESNRVQLEPIFLQCN